MGAFNPNGFLFIPKPEIIWRSDWRIEFERRSAEEAVKDRIKKRAIAKAAIINPVSDKIVTVVRKENSARNPITRRKPFTKFCNGCGKGVKSNTVTGLCQPCLRARPKCPCGRTIYKNNPQTDCKRCYNKAQLKKCGICETVLGAANRSGYCQKHWCRQTGCVRPEDAPTCKECGIRIRCKTKYGLCRTHSGPIHRKVAYEKRRESKADQTGVQSPTQ